MSPKSFVPVTVSLLALLAGHLHAQEEPQTFVQLTEAEDTTQNHADCAIATDGTSTGGKYATGKGDYLPIVHLDTPSLPAAKVAIWVRNRGQAIQLKGILADGTQSDLVWNWSKPAAWEWQNLGTFERAKVAAGIIIIRAPESTSVAGIDSVIITSDLTFRPKAP